MYFYKFQKPGNLEFNMLRRAEIFFASVAELNDASECRPRFILKGSKDLWTRLSEFILQEVDVRYNSSHRINHQEIEKILGLSVALGSQLKKGTGNKDFGLEGLSELFIDTIRPLLDEKFSELQSRLIIEASKHFLEKQLPKIIFEPKYIASFSRKATNPTMWGHYADAEKGFVIVYSSNDEMIHVHSPINVLIDTRPLNEDGFLEVGIYKETTLELQAVNYEKKPPKVNVFHRLIPKFAYSEREDHYDVPLLLEGDAEEKKESLVGLVKYSDWKYEDEVRAFFPTYGKYLPPDIRALRVSISNIRGLIFGPKMSREDKRRAIACCYLMREEFSTQKPKENDCPDEFAFFQAKQVIDSFDFEISPIGILDKIYFDEHFFLKVAKELDESVIERLKAMSKTINI